MKTKEEECDPLLQVNEVLATTTDHEATTTTTNHEAEVPNRPSEINESTKDASPPVKPWGCYIALSLSHLRVQAHLTLWIAKMSAMK